MERITRAFKSEKIPMEQLDNLDIPWISMNEQPPQSKPKDIEWEDNNAKLKNGRIKISRNKRQSKYDVTGLTKTEFNKLRSLL